MARLEEIKAKVENTVSGVEYRDAFFLVRECDRLTAENESLKEGMDIAIDALQWVPASGSIDIRLENTLKRLASLKRGEG